MKAIIIDDERMARDLLELLIHEADKNITVVGKYPNLPKGIEGIKQHKPDVVFLDIEMPEFSGLQLLDYIPHPDFALVFATAYDQYAIKAFELSALDYLLKPIDEDKLALTLDRIGQQIQIKERLQLYKENSLQKQPINICIPNSARAYDMIIVQDILAVEANRNYCCIHTKNKKYILSKSLSYFEEKYMPLDGFERCHRSWVVNTNHIHSFNKSKKHLLLKGTLLNIPISRSNIDRIKEILKNNTLSL
jgi:two-component system LytT family response regulator